MDIHFSDGRKPACGGTGRAVLDPQKVTCVKCQATINRKAQAKKDPIVKCTIFNRDLKKNQDFNFRYEGVDYHGISGAIHRIPKSVAEHLNTLEYPIKEYKEDQESGRSNVAVGTYRRFIVQIHEEIKARPLAKGDPVMAEGFRGKIASLKADGTYDVEFDDGDEGDYEAAELTLIEE